MKTLQMI